ncbi:MAG TPA: putative manganese-dependent inorganic diphosphatase [Syntrophales bacterium]|nr:putative manganese-dependent inorganic diphosphatase [Syntrophales bacterium]
MDRRKKILVFGHRNPDTDSIVSAVAYAELKRSLGIENCFAARCGNVNLQTEYVLERFGIPSPELVGELIPKVNNYMSRGAVTVPQDKPLWQALEILDKGNFKMLPIVDDGGRLLSILHFNSFAQNMLRKIDPNRKGVFPTSVSLLVKTLGAQPVTEFDGDTVFQAQLAVAAFELEAFREHIGAMPAAGTIVLVGNREAVQACVIERKVRVLIVTGGTSISRELKILAEQKGVSVLISPYDTSTTSWLALYSSPVAHTGDKTIAALKEGDYIGAVKERLLSSVSRSLPVVDAEKRVIGVLSQSDLMREPDIDVILVDHNEPSQAVDGIENYRILEIIDHHRLGNIHTNTPITFINRPVGSTSTIIATLYQDNRVPLRKEIASILLAGILSDTVILRSATTTETDRHMAEYLSTLTDLTIDGFGRDILGAASLAARKPVDEILAMDRKLFGDGKNAFTVSQVEVTSLTEVMDRKDEILQGLERQHAKTGGLFTALMVTDITELDSALFVKGDPVFLSRIRYPRMEENVYMMKGILSRKKQLVPGLTELIRKS